MQLDKKKTYKILFVFLALFFTEYVNAVTCSEINGAIVIAYDGKYLGFFGSQYATDSINNTFGTYGSSYSSSSVRNTYGSYGSPYSSYSATNTYTSNPPVIIKNGQIIAYLTTNQFKVGGVSLVTIDANCIFNSTTIITPASFAQSQEYILASLELQRAAILGSYIDYSALMPPSQLTGLMASDGLYSDKVVLTWNLASRATSYEMYFSTSQNGTKTSLGTSTALRAEIIGGTPSVVYYYFVYPKNQFGSGTGLWDTGYVAKPIVLMKDSTTLPVGSFITDGVTSNNSMTTSYFNLAASNDKGVTYKSRFSANDFISVVGIIETQLSDQNIAGSIYIVIHSVTANGDQWAYRDKNGYFQLWNVNLGTIQPALDLTNLIKDNVFVLVDGQLNSGTYDFYIGYKSSANSILHYTRKAFSIYVN